MEKIIKLRKRKALLILVVTFIAAGSLSAFFATEVKQVLSVFKTKSAPLVTTYAELEEALETKKTVRLELPYLDDTGIYYGHESNIKQSFAVSFFEEKYIVILEEGKNEAMRLFDYPNTVMLSVDESYPAQGALEVMIEDYAEYFEVSEAEAAEYIHPVTMRLEGIRSNTYLYLGLLITILVGGIGFYIYRSGKALKDLTKKFSAEEMDRIDYQIAEPLLENKGLIVTKSYVIVKGMVNVDKQFLEIENIAWIYKNVTTHRTNGIKTGTTYQLKVFVNGVKKPIDVNMKEVEVDDSLELLASQSESMVVGYYDNGLYLWKKNPTYLDLKQSLASQME